MRTARLLAGCGVMAILLARTGSAVASDVADAAMNRATPALRVLLQRKADVNLPQADGATALHWAVHFDDVDAVQLLIGAGANVKAANRFGMTPLLLACINGNAAIVEKLLKAGADPNGTLSERGETPLMMAARTGNADTVRVLLASGADVNAKEHSKSQTALMWAAVERHPAIVKLLIERGADVNARSRGGIPPAAPGGAAFAAQTAVAAATAADAAAAGMGGVTPLMLAARENGLDVVSILIDARADPNATSGNGSSALLMAILNGHYQIASFLLDHGANPNIADKDGKAALYAAVEMRNLTTTDTPGPAADKAEALELTRSLLEHGADPSARVKGRPPFRGGANRAWLPEQGATPFFRAAASGDIKVMRLLLAAGADPAVPTQDGTTPLMAAAGIGYLVGSTYTWPDSDALEALKLCVQLGNVNATNNTGWTALHGAAFRGWNAGVQTLVDDGAKFDAPDKRGRTPMNWAEGIYRGGGIAPVRQVETVALLQQLMNKH